MVPAVGVLWHRIIIVLELDVVSPALPNRIGSAVNIQQSAQQPPQAQLPAAQPQSFGQQSSTAPPQQQQHQQPLLGVSPVHEPRPARPVHVEKPELVGCTFKVIKPVKINSGRARDSSQVGTCRPGDIIKVLKACELNGQLRVMYHRGWTSVASRKGAKFLQKTKSVLPITKEDRPALAAPLTRVPRQQAAAVAAAARNRSAEIRAVQERGQAAAVAAVASRQSAEIRAAQEKAVCEAAARKAEAEARIADAQNSEEHLQQLSALGVRLVGPDHVESFTGVHGDWWQFGHHFDPPDEVDAHRHAMITRCNEVFARYSRACQSGESKLVPCGHSKCPNAFFRVEPFCEWSLTFLVTAEQSITFTCPIGYPGGGSHSAPAEGSTIGQQMVRMIMEITGKPSDGWSERRDAYYFTFKYLSAARKLVNKAMKDAAGAAQFAAEAFRSLFATTQVLAQADHWYRSGRDFGVPDHSHDAAKILKIARLLGKLWRDLLTCSDDALGLSASSRDGVLAFLQSIASAWKAEDRWGDDFVLVFSDSAVAARPRRQPKTGPGWVALPSMSAALLAKRRQFLFQLRLTEMVCDSPVVFDAQPKTTTRREMAVVVSGSFSALKLNQLVSYLMDEQTTEYDRRPQKGKVSPAAYFAIHARNHLRDVPEQQRRRNESRGDVSCHQIPICGRGTVGRLEATITDAKHLCIDHREICVAEIFQCAFTTVEPVDKNNTRGTSMLVFPKWDSPEAETVGYNCEFHIGCGKRVSVSVEFATHRRLLVEKPQLPLPRVVRIGSFDYTTQPGRMSGATAQCISGVRPHLETATLPRPSPDRTSRCNWYRPGSESEPQGNPFDEPLLAEWDSLNKMLCGYSNGPSSKTVLSEEERLRHRQPLATREGRAMGAAQRWRLLGIDKLGSDLTPSEVEVRNLCYGIDAESQEGPDGGTL